jgi:hypothetical protein
MYTMEASAHIGLPGWYHGWNIVAASILAQIGAASL